MAKIAPLDINGAMLCGRLGDMMIFMPAPGDHTDRAILATLARVMLIPWLAILITFFLGMGGRGFSTRAVS